LNYPTVTRWFSGFDRLYEISDVVNQAGGTDLEHRRARNAVCFRDDALSLGLAPLRIVVACLYADAFPGFLIDISLGQTLTISYACGVCTPVKRLLALISTVLSEPPTACSPFFRVLPA
ncbi:MAG: hypothetical protein RSC06_15120, partial [Clostridia bacterium]